MLVDKAYPSWPAEERLELVRNQFIHGIPSSSIQLKLLQQNLDTLDAAVELACRLESVESAQSSFQTAKEAAGVTETRDGSGEGAQPGSGYQDLVAQVKSLSHQLDNLRRGKRQGHARSEVHAWNAENRATYVGIVCNGGVTKPQETGETGQYILRLQLLVH